MRPYFFKVVQGFCMIIRDDKKKKKKKNEIDISRTVFAIEWHLYLNLAVNYNEMQASRNFTWEIEAGIINLKPQIISLSLSVFMLNVGEIK